jgi:hypothetical protein
MAEEQRLDPVRDIRDGDIVVFNAELLKATHCYATYIYLTDYFSSDDPDSHTMYTVYIQGREVSSYDDYCLPKETKQQLYEAYCKKAHVLSRGLSREEILAIHKQILEILVRQHYENTESAEVILAREKDNCAKIKEAIARTMRSISGRIYRAANAGHTYVDIDFNTVTVKPMGVCSDGKKRETPEGYVAFILLGSMADELPHEFLVDYIRRQVCERFPHLLCTMKKQGAVFPVLRIMFAEQESMDMLL